MPDEPSRKDVEELRAVSAAIEEGLVDLLPGLSILDRDLELSDGQQADLVAVDASRRLVLVLVTSGKGAEALCAAAEALVFARAGAGALARHLAASDLRTDLPPRVVLVSDGFDASAIERLALLEGADLSLFDLCEVRSARGASLYLRPRAGQDASHGAPGTVRVQDFLEGVPDELGPLAKLAVERIDRVDDLLEREATAGAVQWRFTDRPLCALAEVDGRLEASLPGGGGPTRIESEGDVDLFLDRVLARQLELLRSEGPPSPREPGPAPGGALFESGPLLTPEELEAFRD